MRDAEEPDDDEESGLTRSSKPPTLEAGVLAEVRATCTAESDNRHNVLMVVTLVLLALIVIGQSAMRDIKHEWKPCAVNEILSKHKFCVNVTLPIRSRIVSG